MQKQFKYLNAENPTEAEGIEMKLEGIALQEKIQASLDKQKMTKEEALRVAEDLKLAIDTHYAGSTQPDTNHGDFLKEAAEEIAEHAVGRIPR